MAHQARPLQFVKMKGNRTALGARQGWVADTEPWAVINLMLKISNM